MLALVAYSLKPVKLLGPCKRTQHCWPTTPNNVGSCWHLLCPFAWVFKVVQLISFSFLIFSILFYVLLLYFILFFVFYISYKKCKTLDFLYKAKI